MSASGHQRTLLRCRSDVRFTPESGDQMVRKRCLSTRPSNCKEHGWAWRCTMEEQNTNTNPGIRASRRQRKFASILRSVDQRRYRVSVRRALWATLVLHCRATPRADQGVPVSSCADSTSQPAVHRDQQPKGAHGGAPPPRRAPKFSKQKRPSAGARGQPLYSAKARRWGTDRALALCSCIYACRTTVQDAGATSRIAAIPGL